MHRGILSKRFSRRARAITGGAAAFLLALNPLAGRADADSAAGARVPLAAANAPVFAGVTTPGAPAGAVPNYLRALAALPNTVKPFANLYSTMLYGGTIAPEVKMAMGVRVAELNDVPYVAAHLRRLMQGTEEGRRLLSGEGKNEVGAKRAVEYAAALTRSVHGVDEKQRDALRASYNDAQIVELTMVNCFFNYFTRLCAATGVEKEIYLSDPATNLPGRRAMPSGANVALASDAEMDAAAKIRTGGATSLGKFTPNSRRAMVRVPDLMDAWNEYGASVRPYDLVSRPEKLQVSFAVSEVNGCRYCVLHQTLGLKNSGVDIAKLVAMKKDDSALTPREKTAVDFARKLTKKPDSVTDADWKSLTDQFTEQGAMEVLLQTCTFNFMNRFTDPLHLPSEDEAVKVYHEVYGDGAYDRFFADRKITP